MASHDIVMAAAGGQAGDPYWDDVTLLLTGNGTNGAQNNTFLDSSTNNFTITRNGNATQGSFSPYSSNAPYNPDAKGGSGYFDGTGDYLTTSGADSFNASSGDWTVEAWIYCTDAANNDTLITGNTSNFYIVWLGTTLYLGDGIQNTLVVSNAKPTNQWFHLAIVKNGSVYTGYINGTSIGNVSVALSNTTLSNWTIGYFSGAGAYMKGYISNLRVVKGTAVYTSNFTPPTSPVTAITNTNLLLNFTNAGIPDAAMQNDLETVGNAQVSTSVKKYGTGSLAFDGTGDYLVSNFLESSNLNSGDFTVEAWVYPTSFSGFPCVAFWNSNSSNTYANVYIAFGTSGDVYFYGGTGWAVAIASGSSVVSLNTWQHIAAVRNGTSFTLYVNGSTIASATYSGSLGITATQNFVGTRGATTQPFFGYIDDLRITKGYARYTANFTPPDAAFPTF